MKQRILGCFPHLSIILSTMLLTFWVTDRFNTAMAFINHPMTKRLVMILIVLKVICVMQLAFVKEERTRLLRLIIGALSGISALVTVVLLCIDDVYPARLLFTKDSVKSVLLVLAVTAIGAAVLLIVCQRNALRQSAKRSEKDEVTDK